MPQPEGSRTLRFGDFELDLAACELRRLGKPVRLERQPMDLLILLAERRGRLVPRADIVERLWGPGVFVDIETGVNTAIRKVRQALQDSPDSPLFIETVSGRGYRFIVEATQSRTEDTAQTSVSSPPRVMLAVLPFEDLSNDPEREYFSDGLTEETISYLGRINPDRMGVIARTTSMAYKRTRKSIREIGAELGVDYVLESSVRQEENRVRITSQLIRVNDQTNVWASTYDREVTGVLAIQSELGTAIADHVRLQLSPERLNALTHQTFSAEAYDLYLRGRYFWNQLSPPTTKRAVEYYARATQLDPHYALAWSGLSDAYATSPINGDAPPMQVWPKARDAAGRAIQVAPDLAETQTSHGFVKFWLDWEWNAAEAAFRNAILLNPSYSLAHRMLGLILMHLCRHDESMAAAKRGRELDPLNMAQQALSAQVAFGARKYEAAVEFSRQAIAIDPEFWIGYMQLGQAFEQLEQPEMALSALADATRLSGGNSKPLSLRGFILARRDQTQQAHDVLRTLEMASGQKFVPPYAFALVYAGLGEQERALQFLEYAYDAHDVHLAFLTCDPKWDSFRRLERFAALLDRCGFEAKVKADTAAPDR